MTTDLQIDVGTLDAPHRQALEEVIGQELAANQRLLIKVTDLEPPALDQRPPQSLADWTSIYDGLSDAEIEEIDKIIKTRANLTRPLP